MFFSIVATHEAQVMPLTVKKHFSYSCSTSLLNRTAAGLSSTVLADFPNPLPVDKSNLVPSTQQRKLLVRQVCNCACLRISWSKQRWIYSFLAKVYKAIKKGKQKRSNHPNLKKRFQVSHPNTVHIAHAFFEQWSWFYRSHTCCSSSTETHLKAIWHSIDKNTSIHCRLASHKERGGNICSKYYLALASKSQIYPSLYTCLPDNLPLKLQIQFSIFFSPDIGFNKWMYKSCKMATYLKM